MNKLIRTTLEQTGKPVAYQNYTGNEAEYIRFFYLPQTDFQADDDESLTTHFVQVDYFTPYNTIQTKNDIKKYMKQAGFKKNFEHEVFEEDTKLFHVILRFWKIKEDI